MSCNLSRSRLEDKDAVPIDFGLKPRFGRGFGDEIDRDRIHVF